MTRLTEISNPAAVAWHLESEGIEHAITWIRGTERISFGVKSNMTGQWHDTAIVAPERFGFDGTLSGARIAAQNFVAGKEIDQ